MTVTVKVLIPAKTAESSQTTQYTATNVITIIDKFTATNFSATAATLTHLVDQIWCFRQRRRQLQPSR